MQHPLTSHPYKTAKMWITIRMFQRYYSETRAQFYVVFIYLYYLIEYSTQRQLPTCHHHSPLSTAVISRSTLPLSSKGAMKKFAKRSRQLVKCFRLASKWNKVCSFEVHAFVPPPRLLTNESKSFSLGYFELPMKTTSGGHKFGWSYDTHKQSVLVCARSHGVSAWGRLAGRRYPFVYCLP